MREQDSRTALRLPSEQRKIIDKLVNEGKFKSLSAVVREALDQFLRKQRLLQTKVGQPRLQQSPATQQLTEGNLDN